MPRDARPFSLGRAGLPDKSRLVRGIIKWAATGPGEDRGRFAILLVVAWCRPAWLAIPASVYP